MPPLVIDIRSADDSRDVVHRAVQALHEGHFVVFPTETVYTIAVSALNAGAVERLAALPECDDEAKKHDKPLLTLAVKSTDDALDYLPTMSELSQRLARRCWPGPVTLICENNHPESLLTRLPAVTQKALTHDGHIAVRVPGHALFLDTLRMLPGPVVMRGACGPNHSEALTAQEAQQAMGDYVQLILDDGRSRFGQPATEVKVNDHFTIVRSGVVSEQTLRRLSAMMILLVCTGNTCRSPMAEGLCRQMIAEKLGCRGDELQDKGVLVMSAGVSANFGGGATAEAITALKPLDIDLSLHESQPVTEQLIHHADVIWTMTRSHRQAILDQWPEAGQRAQVLSMNERDIADPIGGPLEYYRKCAEQIKIELEQRLRELKLPGEVKRDAL